jgi:hypothetical protein
MESLLTQKAVVLAKVETTPGVDAAPVEATDAVLVEEPQYSIDPTVLERNFTRSDLSPYPHLMGRKLARLQFVVEARGNGIVDSGLLADAPIITRFLQACGYAVAAIPAGTGQIGPVIPDAQNDPSNPAVVWVAGGVPTVTKPILYTIEVTTGGASGVAEVTVTGNNDAVDDLTPPLTSTITSGTPEALGAAGGTIAGTWAGNLVQGSKYRVLVTPPGVKATPVSTGFKTITLYAYFDGLLHKVTGAVGTFSVQCEAGGYGRFTFEFTGSYVPVTDAAMPANPVYETTLPPVVELANLTWGSMNTLVAASWAIEQANAVVPRSDVNAADGFNGMRITRREPSGSFTPEATLEADNPFWDDLANSRSKYFSAVVGDTAGNMLVFDAPRAQSNGLQYGDRDGIRTLDVGLRFKRYVGNDELRFIFC